MTAETLNTTLDDVAGAQGLNSLSEAAALPSMVPDTLLRPVPADSIGLADSVSFTDEAYAGLEPAFGDYLSGAGAQAGELFEKAAPEHIFGPQSVFAGDTVSALESIGYLNPLTDNICFKLLVIACFAGICLIVYFNKTQIAALFNIFRGRLYTEKLLEEQNYVFDKFVNTAMAITLSSLGIAIVKFAEPVLGERIMTALPQWAAECFAPALCLICGMMLFVKSGMLATAGYLTYSQSFASTLIRLRKLIIATGAVTLAPVILLFAMSSGTGALMLGYAVMAVAAAIVIFLLMRTYVLFITQKISIFYWILYLCAVEIFPISLFILITLRNI